MTKFVAQIKDKDSFKSLIEFLAAIREDVYFTFTTYGTIKFKSQDYSRTSLVQGEIKTAMFVATKEKPTQTAGNFSLCLSVKELNKWLKRIKKDEIIRLEIEDMNMNIISPNRKFQLHAMDVEDLEGLKTFTREFEVKFKANLEDLYEKTQDIAMASEAFRLETQEDGLLFRCPKLPTIKKVWSKLLVPNLPQDIVSGFGVQFYEPLKVLIGQIETVDVNFGYNAPMIINIKTPEYQLDYVFAPRLEVEE